MDWSALTPLLANAAPTIGSLLGGLIPFPGGSILGQVAGKILAESLGVGGVVVVGVGVCPGVCASGTRPMTNAPASATTLIDMFRLILT